MKRLRLERWASQLQHPPRNPRLCPGETFCEASAALQHRRQYNTQYRLSLQRRDCIQPRRKASSATAPQEREPAIHPILSGEAAEESKLNAPSHKKAFKSAKLSALHARLSLPSKLPLQTLATCLIDVSVDPRPGYNNSPFAALGLDILGYYTSEYLLCHYPRLPMEILFAAQHAYVGPATLAALRHEWGVEHVAAPGPEVDAGLLQFKRLEAGNAMSSDGRTLIKDLPSSPSPGRSGQPSHFRRGISSRIVFDDQFGEPLPPPEEVAPYEGAPITTRSPNDSQPPPKPVSLEIASSRFIHALFGALYLHAGTAAAKNFHKEHILSRHLRLADLFHFDAPTRDLSRLCKREELEPPVARLISETGRLSRHPVFLVGVYSGDEKLGEGVGASLDEGRVRAAVAALKSWYLYSPPQEDIVVPSDVEGEAGKTRKWKPQMVDIGQVVT